MTEVLSALVKAAVKESAKNQLATTALAAHSEARAAQIAKKLAKKTVSSGVSRTKDLASGREREFDPGQRVKQELSRLADKGLHVVAPNVANTLRNVRQFQTVVNATKALITADNPLTVAMSLRTLVSSHKALLSESSRSGGRSGTERSSSSRSLYYFGDGRAIRYNVRDEKLWRAAQSNGGVLNNRVIEGLCARMPEGDKAKFRQNMTAHLRQLCRANMLTETVSNSGVYSVTTLFYEKHLVYESHKALPGSIVEKRAQLDSPPRADEVSLNNTDRKIMNRINKCTQSSDLKFDPVEERRRIAAAAPAVEAEKKLRAFDRSLDKLQRADLIQVQEGVFNLTDKGRTRLAEQNELNRLRDIKDFKVGAWDHKNILRPVAASPKSLAEWETDVRKQYSGPEADRQWLMVSRRIEKHAAAGNVLIENGQVRLSDQGHALVKPPEISFDFSKYDAQQIMPRLHDPISRDDLRQSFVEKYPNQATLDRQWAIFEKRLAKNIAAGMVNLDENGYLSISERGHETLESFRNKPQTAQARPAADDTKTLIISKQDARIMQYTRDGVFSEEAYRQLRRQESPEIENDLIDQELLIINRRLSQLQTTGLAERIDSDTVKCSDFLAARSRVALDRSRKPKEIVLSHEQDELVRSLGVFANVTREQALQHIYGGRIPLFELDMSDLKRRGLIDTVNIHVKNFGEQQVLGLSKLGRQVAGYRIGDDQILTESKVNTRPAEMAHDLLIFDAYQDAKERLAAAGKDVTIVYSDRQSKSIDMRELGRQDEAYADLKVVYKDRETGEIGTLNLEVAVNYKDHEIAKKSSIANCLWYTPGAAQASRIRRVLPGAQVIQFA